MKANQAREKALEVIRKARKFEKQFSHANKMVSGMANRGQFSVRFVVNSKDSPRVLAEAMMAKFTQEGYSCKTEYVSNKVAKTINAKDEGKVTVFVSSV